MFLEDLLISEGRQKGKAAPFVRIVSRDVKNILSMFLWQK